MFNGERRQPFFSALTCELMKEFLFFHIFYWFNKMMYLHSESDREKVWGRRGRGGVLLARSCIGVYSLTSWASAGGCSIRACQAGGVVQAGIVDGAAGVMRQAAKGPAEERRTGAGELPRYV